LAKPSLVFRNMETKTEALTMTRRRRRKYRIKVIFAPIL
jgi:hypothetical protein